MASSALPDSTEPDFDLHAIDDKLVLRNAAVIGEVFWDAAVLAQIRCASEALGAVAEGMWPDADMMELQIVLRRLEEHQSIERFSELDLPGAEAYRFTPPETRQTFYESMTIDQRRSRHAMAAHWFDAMRTLQRDGLDNLAAPHLERCGRTEEAGQAYLAAAYQDSAKMRTALALRHTEKALTLLSTTQAYEKINALHHYGALLTTLGRYDEALHAFAEMLEKAWMLNARAKGAAALNRMARVHRQRGNDGDASHLLDQALELFRRADDQRGVAATLDDLAQIRGVHGDTERGMQNASEALAIRRSHHDVRGEAQSLATLATIHLTMGRLQEAEELAQRSLEIRLSIHDYHGAMYSHYWLGVIALERGEAEEAMSFWGTSLEQAREVTDKRLECFVLSQVGEALIALGKFEAAGRSLNEADRLATQLGDLRAAVEVTCNLGVLAAAEGNEDAGVLLAEALRLAEKYDSKPLIARVCRATARWHAKTLFDEGAESEPAAVAAFRRSVSLYLEIGNERDASICLADFGRFALERGRHDAKIMLQNALTIMQRLGMAEATETAQMLLAATQ